MFLTWNFIPLNTDISEICLFEIFINSSSFNFSNISFFDFYIWSFFCSFLIFHFREPRSKNDSTKKLRRSLRSLLFTAKALDDEPLLNGDDESTTKSGGGGETKPSKVVYQPLYANEEYRHVPKINVTDATNNNSFTYGKVNITGTHMILTGLPHFTEYHVTVCMSLLRFFKFKTWRHILLILCCSRHFCLFLIEFVNFLSFSINREMAGAISGAISFNFLNHPQRLQQKLFVKIGQFSAISKNLWQNFILKSI